MLLPTSTQRLVPNQAQEAEQEAGLADFNAALAEAEAESEKEEYRPAPTRPKSGKKKAKKAASEPYRPGMYKNPDPYAHVPEGDAEVPEFGGAGGDEFLGRPTRPKGSKKEEDKVASAAGDVGTYDESEAASVEVDAGGDMDEEFDNVRRSSEIRAEAIELAMADDIEGRLPEILDSFYASFPLLTWVQNLFLNHSY